MIQEQVINIAREVISDDELTLETSIYNGTDSLDRVGLVFDIETEFNISISDEEARTIKTVGDIVSMVEMKLGLVSV